ncbi:unnamed protein product [Diatraea saccharalis]|uniref:Uncharacterized protein n=1 Tax=Diatraea saccharalis TaxID=40085 RepID=A0A9N9WD30_9NEOP|nr:unnamed protein product [Diatraea saccharalis]
MSFQMPLLMLAVCACARGEPLPEAVQWRSDMHGGVYARHYPRGYKPIAYAALSMHSPIPLLHIMSRVPLRPEMTDRQTAASGAMPTYALPYNQPGPYMYAASVNDVVQDNYSEPDEPVVEVLYARPNPQGGYSYRRRPTKKRVTRPEPEPVIIRVQKYKIIRDR